MFIKDSFIDLLNELSGAQESIEKVSVWIQQYRDQAPVIAQAWKNFYVEASQEKKLTLLFLVNDVLQHSKRKGPQFVDAFGHILPKCMSECKNTEAKSQIERMLDIWESREVFHKHIISAMKYSIDEIGMDDTYVKLTDLMDSLDLLRSHEKKSSEVLTKLSHRLDTTDFANAFNVTSRKEGDKYAADFDETAHFLEQYCSCLLKQTEARSEMIRKMNSTMFQMEKAEETIKTQDKEYKTQQTTMVRTRKAITSRLMLIEEGKVNFGDDSPDKEEIENLTSEEEDVDIEGIETVEYQKVNRRDSFGRDFCRFRSFCLNIENNPLFQSILEQYNICKQCSPLMWTCAVYLSMKVLLHCFILKYKQTDVGNSGLKSKKCKLSCKIDTACLDANLVAKSLPVYQVFMMNGRYGPSLPRNMNSSNFPMSQNYGPRLPSNFDPNMPVPVMPPPIIPPLQKFGPSLPANTPAPCPSVSAKLGPPLPDNQGSRGMFGPALPMSTQMPVLPVSAHGPVLPTTSPGPALPATLTNLVNDPTKFGPPLPVQTYSRFGPALPPAPVFSSFPSDASNEKFGPPVPETVKEGNSKSKTPPGVEDDYLPPVPENCHTSIERLLKLYDTKPQVLGDTTNLQDVFGGNARGFDPLDEDLEPKIISQSLEVAPKKEEVPEDHASANNPVANVLQPILQAYIGSFQPPKFSSFPTDVVDAVIKGNPDKGDSNIEQKAFHPGTVDQSSMHKHSTPSRHGHRSPRQRSPPRHRSPPRQQMPPRRSSPPRHRSPPRQGAPPRHRSPPRKRTPPRHRSPPRQKSPCREKSPHKHNHQHSLQRKRSPRREKSPHAHHRRSPHHDRRQSPHHRQSPPRGDKSIDRSRSDSGRHSDRDRPSDKHNPMFPPKGLQPKDAPMGPPLVSPMGPPHIGGPMLMGHSVLNQNVNAPTDMQQNRMRSSNDFTPARFSPMLPPNNSQGNRFGPPMPPNKMPNMQPNRFGPPMPPNNMHPNRFGPPMPPNSMDQNRFGPPVPSNMRNMQRPGNFGPPGGNYPPQRPGMGGPGPMNMMGQQMPPAQFNRGFPPPQGMMRPGPFRPR